MVSTNECITHGPWGGSLGEEWVYMPQEYVRKISVRHDCFMDSIKFQTFNSIGETQATFIGGRGGNRTDTICIDYPGEYLISISGTLGYHQGFKVVNSICFVTNENRYGPYGTASGTAFSYDGKGGVIVGFHGRANTYLTSIGVYVMPGSLAFNQRCPLSQSSIIQSQFYTELNSSMVKMARPRDPGPWGGSKGTPWDDGVFCAIIKVYVHLNVLKQVSGIQIEYLKKDGKLVLSPVRGQAATSVVEMINLDAENEYLTGISGVSAEEIRSITFHTNRRTYGPYGGEGLGPNKFTSISPSSSSIGKIVGIHGFSAPGQLTKLAVHMEYFL